MIGKCRFGIRLSCLSSERTKQNKNLFTFTYRMCIYFLWQILELTEKYKKEKNHPVSYPKLAVIFYLLVILLVFNIYLCIFIYLVTPGLSWGMWGLVSWLGIQPETLPWEHRVLATGQQGGLPKEAHLHPRARPWRNANSRCNILDWWNPCSVLLD